MRQNSVEVDIAALKYVNLLRFENIFTIIFFIIMYNLWKQSVSEFSGPHDMEAMEKKKS